MSPEKQYSREIEVYGKSFRHTCQVCKMFEDLLKTMGVSYGISKRSDQWALVYDDVKLVFRPIPPASTENSNWHRYQGPTGYTSITGCL